MAEMQEQRQGSHDSERWTLDLAQNRVHAAEKRAQSAGAQVGPDK